MRKVLLSMWVLGSPVVRAQEAEDEAPVEAGSTQPTVDDATSEEDAPASDAAQGGNEAETVAPSEETETTTTDESGEESNRTDESDEDSNRTDEASIVPNAPVESLDESSSPPVSTEPKGPEDLVINYEEGDPESADLSKAMLLDYCLKSKTVVVGKVLTSRVEVGVLDELVELRVEEILRGEPPPVITARVPIPEPDGGFIDGNVAQSARVIPGYRLLVFLDPTGTVVNGDAVFFTESGFAFRNKRADNFLRPRSDRDWIENVDPSVDYYVYTIQAVQNALEMNPMDYKKLKGEESGKKKRKWFCPFRRDK